MTKKKTVITEKLLKEIQDYLLNHPEKSMEAVRLHFNMGVKLFRRTVRDELKMWKPKSRNQKRWPTNLNQIISECFEEKPETLVQAYSIFLQKYQKTEPAVHFYTFRYFANQLGLLTKINRNPVIFLRTDFSGILRDWSNETEKKHPNSRTVRRVFLEFLKKVKNAPELLELDPTLQLEHKTRYEKIGTSACWTCGKSEHFSAPIPLDIDHISGNSLNHSLSNLRLLCGCCHHITTTRSRVYKPNAERLQLYDNFETTVDLNAMKNEFETQLKKL